MAYLAVIAVMDRKELLYVVVLVVFLLLVVAFYFQGRRYAAMHEKEAPAADEMIIRVIPAPSRPLGTLARASFCRIPAMARMAKNQPIPLPSPKVKDDKRS